MGALLTVAAMTVAACSGGGDDTAPTTTVDGATNTPATVPPSGGGGGTGGSGGTTDTTGASATGTQLGLRLSEGTPAVGTAESLTVASGTPLSDEEVAAIIDRLPDWTVPGTDVVDFNRPVESLQPPLVGDTLDAPFPPAPDAPSVPDAVASGPLEVLRFQPEGAVDIAPFIALTFNEPMVELATLDQLDDLDVPVQITPDITETAGIDGRWRWIGTRTLRFEVTPTGDTSDGNEGLDRLPASTEYTVTVPAGTESANGAVLADEVTFTFATPAVTVTNLFGPSDSMRLDPVFVATFDQRVDADAIVELIEFEAGDVSGVRLATPAEIDADTRAAGVIESALDGRTVAFVPTAELEPDTPVSIRSGPTSRRSKGPAPTPSRTPRAAAPIRRSTSSPPTASTPARRSPRSTSRSTTNSTALRSTRRGSTSSRPCPACGSTTSAVSCRFAARHRATRPTRSRSRPTSSTCSDRRSARSSSRSSTWATPGRSSSAPIVTS